MTIMKYVLYYILLLSLLAGCRENKETPDGGPCTYETKTWMATVVKIETGDSLHHDVIFIVKNENGELVRDSVSWYMENKTWLTKTDLAKDSVTIGRKFKYLVDEIKTGACNPLIEKLTLEKY